MLTVTRRFEFDSAHRLLGYPGACANVHGHRYIMDVTIRGEQLDSLGMLMDFGELKRIVMGWINRWWDHCLILNPDDPTEVDQPHGPGGTYFMTDGNPTAELMVQEAFNAIELSLPASVVLHRIRLYETPDCYVEFTR